MPTNDSSVQREFRELQHFVTNLFPTPSALTFLVTSQQQERELSNVRDSQRTEQFFFIVDFINLQIIEAAGLEQMGYHSSGFTFRKYLSIIPGGGMLQLITMLGKEAFRFSEKSNVVFMNPKFVAHIPMTTADGRVMLVKRTISPWQFTSTGYITAYLSEFMILKPYENEPMHPRFINLDPSVEEAYNSQLTKIFANLSARESPFTHKEIDLLKLYVNPLYDNATAKEIAALAEVKANTLNKHNSNILTKAKERFGRSIPAKTAREVAQFLKRCGLLS